MTPSFIAETENLPLNRRFPQFKNELLLCGIGIALIGYDRVTSAYSLGLAAFEGMTGLST